jgi:hypothetical protein
MVVVVEVEVVDLQAVVELEEVEDFHKEVHQLQHLQQLKVIMVEQERQLLTIILEVVVEVHEGSPQRTSQYTTAPTAGTNLLGGGGGGSCCSGQGNACNCQGCTIGGKGIVIIRWQYV